MRTIQTNSGIKVTIEKRTQVYKGRTIERDTIVLHTDNARIYVDLANDPDLGSHARMSVHPFDMDGCISVADRGFVTGARLYYDDPRNK